MLLTRYRQVSFVLSFLSLATSKPPKSLASSRPQASRPPWSFPSSPIQKYTDADLESIEIRLNEL